MSCKFFSLSTYDYIWNTCLHQIDERELVTYIFVLQLLHDESHPSHSSITNPLPTSLLLLVLATLLCLGLSLATRGIGPLCCCCHYCCYLLLCCCCYYYSLLLRCYLLQDFVGANIPSTRLFLGPLPVDGKYSFSSCEQVLQQVAAV